MAPDPRARARIHSINQFYFTNHLTKTATRARIPPIKKQQDFFKLNREFAPDRISHGASDCIGKRKIARPFKRNCAIHLVLKSKNAKGALNLLTARNRAEVAKIFTKQAKKFGVKIHSEQNVGNHLHAVISSGSRENFRGFLRAATGLIAKFVLNGKPGKFWTQIPFTRLITGKRDFSSMLNYISKNSTEATLGKSARTEIEAEESVARKNRKNELARLRRRACNSC